MTATPTTTPPPIGDFLANAPAAAPAAVPADAANEIYVYPCNVCKGQCGWWKGGGWLEPREFDPCETCNSTGVVTKIETPTGTVVLPGKSVMMEQHSEDFGLSLVRDYLSGTLPAESVADYRDECPLLDRLVRLRESVEAFKALTELDDDNTPGTDLYTTIKCAELLLQKLTPFTEATTQ